MAEIDVLLINVPSSKANRILAAEVASMPPLGLLYIASELQASGYAVKVLDLAVELLVKDEIINYLVDSNPKVIGISSFYESWSAMKSLCFVIRRVLPDAKIVIGGNCATFSYEQILKEIKADFVILGEGEYATTNLCDALFHQNKKIEHISGLAYIDKDGMVVRNEPERIMNLDKLKFPDRSLIKLDRYVYPFSISTARGCVGQCIFCSSKAFWKKKVIFRSVENVVDEIMEIKSVFNANEFFIIDDTFTMIPDRAKEFCRLLKSKNEKFTWFCESRADVASEELLKMLYEAGCRKIQFGMESGNDEILKKIGKNITTAQIENAVKLASKIGFSINVSFIIGHAFDTLETIKQSFELAKKMKVEYGANVLCSINTPYPGTEIYEKRELYGIKLLTENWDNYTMNNPVIDTRYMEGEELRSLFYSYYNELVDMKR